MYFSLKKEISGVPDLEIGQNISEAPPILREYT